MELNMLNSKKKKTNLILSLIALGIITYFDSQSNNPVFFKKTLLPSNVDPSFIIMLILPIASLLLLAFYIVQRIYTGRFIKWEQALRDASMELGLKFTNAAMADDSIIHNSSDLSAHKTDYLLRAMRFCLKIKNIRIEGIYKGIDLSIHFEEDEDHNERIVLTSRFPSPLSMGLLIQPHNSATNMYHKFKNKVASMPFELKNHVSITSSNANSHQKKIQQTIDSELVKKIYRYFPQTIISDEKVKCTKYVSINVDDPPNFKNIITILVGASNMVYTCMSK
jgi:hypothetical protein